VRFALEALGEPLVRNLDGDDAIQPRVASLVDFSHTAGAQGRGDLVGAQPDSGSQSHEVNDCTASDMGREWMTGKQEAKCCNQAIALIDLVAAIAPEANSIPLPDYGIAGVCASWHNNEALADLRHGTAVSRPVKKRPTCVFWQAYLCPRATGG